jgi:GTP-binding protein Era
LNKIDNSNQEQLEEQVAFWTAKVPNAEIFQYQLCKTLMSSFGRIIEFCQNQRIIQKIN